jgi:predicted metal-binding protein
MPETMTDVLNIAVAPTIYICTTCRPPGEPDSAVRPGVILATAVAQAAAGTEVDVRPMRCLGNCSRGASAARERLVDLSVRLPT